MPDIHTDLTPHALAHVIEANILAYYAYHSHILTGEEHDTPDLWWSASGIPEDLFNGVLRARFKPATVDAEIAAALQPFQARGLPMCWHIGPSSFPPDLGEHLPAHGVQFVETEPGMAMDLHKMPAQVPIPAGLTIVPVNDAAGLSAWLQAWASPEVPPAVMANFFAAFMELGFAAESPLRLLVGSRAGIPVSTGAIFCAAGVAAVHHIVTQGDARRQGIGAAMTYHILRQARDAGYRVAVLTASPQGFPIYQRLGFRAYCDMHTYTYDPRG